MISIYAKSFMTATRIEPFRAAPKTPDHDARHRMAPSSARKNRLLHMLRF
jgi:hypothetical protein